MKAKLLNLLLVLTSLVGYLQWGGNNSIFLFQAEIEIVSKMFDSTSSVIHPFTVLPLAGQLVLLFTLFQKQPGKWLTYFGMASVGVLLLFMFLIGLLSLNFKILLSTIPFLSVSIATISYHRKAKREALKK